MADKSPSKKKRFVLLSFFLAASSGLPILGLVLFVRRGHELYESSRILVSLVGLIFVVTVAVSVATVAGHPPVMTLAPLIPSRRQRAMWRDMRRRPKLDDEEFYVRFYREAGIPKEVTVRLRALYAQQLGISRVFPEDRAADFDDDLDFGELLIEVAEEFGIDFSDEEAQTLADNGTFDALVRHLSSIPYR